MIVKATFKDNDHTQHLENFFNGFFTRMLNYLYVAFEKTNSKDVDNFSKAFDEYQRFQKIFNPNINEKLSNEDKEFAIEKIKEAIIAYMEDIGQDNINYFRDNLEVKFVASYFDKWENGETLYYFSKCNQCLIN